MWTLENRKEMDFSLSAFLYRLICYVGFVKPLFQAVVCWSGFLLAYRTN